MRADPCRLFPMRSHRLALISLWKWGNFGLDLSQIYAMCKCNTVGGLSLCLQIQKRRQKELDLRRMPTWKSIALTMRTTSKMSLKYRRVGFFGFLSSFLGGLVNEISRRWKSWRLKHRQNPEVSYEIEARSFKPPIFIGTLNQRKAVVLNSQRFAEVHNLWLLEGLVNLLLRNSEI